MLADKSMVFLSYHSPSKECVCCKQNQRDMNYVINRTPVDLLVGAILVLLLCLGTARDSYAQSDTEQVWTTVQSFFQALSTSDSTLLSQVYMPEGRFYSVAENQNRIRTGSSTQESVHAMFRRPGNPILERGWNPSISIHGRAAVASVPYDFYTNTGAFSHCGTDIFSLVKNQSRWIVASVTYTVERENCPESPLGSPFVYQGVSNALPTGASGIAPTGLVRSFDMTTLTDDGRLRDLGPARDHAEVGYAEVEHTEGGGQLAGANDTRTTRSFDSVEDRVYLPENKTLEMDGPISIAVRLRVRQLDIHQHIIACDDKFALWITPDNLVRFSDADGHGVDSSLPVAKDAWLSLVAVYSGTSGDEVTTTNPSLYVDGERMEGLLVNRDDSAIPVWNPRDLFPSDACYIGFESHQGLESHKELSFIGDIDDLMLFSRALTEAEIKIHATRK